MSKPSAPGGFEPPSGRTIVVGSLVALVVALLVLVAIIWPAEYGRDPTGIGGALGITNLSTDQSTQTIEIVDNIGGNEVLREVEIPDFGDPVPLPNPNVAQAEELAPETRTVTVELGQDAETEIKLVLAKDKMVVFDWAVEGGMVYSDFHGHTPEYGEDFWVRYREDQRGASSGHGSLVAPFSGEHGWYWVNLSDGPVTVELTVTGYFEDVIDYSAAF
jgi:hypothetical protein